MTTIHEYFGRSAGKKPANEATYLLFEYPPAIVSPFLFTCLPTYFFAVPVFPAIEKLEE